MQYTTPTNNVRIPVASNGRHERVNQTYAQQHQTNSAPSTLVSRQPQR
jgi:hypothetical protein